MKFRLQIILDSKNNTRLEVLNDEAMNHDEIYNLFEKAMHQLKIKEPELFNNLVFSSFASLNASSDQKLISIFKQTLGALLKESQ